MNTKVVYVSTRMFQGDDAKRTKLTIDASQLTTEDMMEYVVDSAVIKWQSAIRRKKDSVIPAEATYKVPKPGTRAQVQITEAQAMEMLVKTHGSVEGAIQFLRQKAADIELENAPDPDEDESEADTEE